MKKLFLILLLLLLPALAEATTRYASVAGGGSSPCTNSTTRCSLTAALAVTVAGDRLNVAAGTYSTVINTDSLTINSGNSFDDAPVINCESGTCTLTGGINIKGGVHHVIFFGFTVRTNGIRVGSDEVGGANPGHHIRFINIDAGSTVENVVQIQRFGHHNEFIGGRYHDAPFNTAPCIAGGGGDSCYGFYIEGDDNLLDHVTVDTNPGYGIHIASGYPEVPERNVVRFSSVHDNGQSSTHSNAGITAATGATNTQIYGNLVYNNGRNGISTELGATGTVISFNTVTNNNTSGNQNGGILFATGGGSAVIKNNLLWRNISNGASGYTDFDDQGTGVTPTFSGNLCTATGSRCANIAAVSTIPFTSTSNFHLTSLSPAIGLGGSTFSGCPGAGYCFDYDAQVRPQSGTFDAGAYEFVGGTIPVVTITSTGTCVGSLTACTTSANTVTLGGTMK